MNDADQIELDAVQAALEQLRKEQPALTGDTLLNAAIRQAGYVVEDSRIELCNNCGALYHADYGGEYVDPLDCQDLQAELGLRSIKTLHYMHFCGFACLREKAGAE